VSLRKLHLAPVPRLDLNSKTSSLTMPVAWLFQCVRNAVSLPAASPWVTPKSAGAIVPWPASGRAGPVGWMPQRRTSSHSIDLDLDRSIGKHSDVLDGVPIPTMPE